MYLTQYIVSLNPNIFCSHHNKPIEMLLEDRRFKLRYTKHWERFPKEKYIKKNTVIKNSGQGWTARRLVAERSSKMEEIMPNDPQRQ